MSRALNVFIAAGDSEWSGYTAQAVLKTGATIVGMALDTTPHKAKIVAADNVSLQQRIQWHLGLAQRLPRSYAQLAKTRLIAKIGRKPKSDYAALQEAKHNARALLERDLGPSAALLPDDALSFPTLSEIATANDIPLLEVSDLNSSEAIARISQHDPDIIVGQGTRILKPEFLAIPKVGVLNGHSSLLPNFRGGAAEFWQLAARNTDTGVSIHWMNKSLDSGAIVAQESWPILPGSNHHQLRKLSLVRRASLWALAIDRILAGDMGVPQTVGPTKPRVFRFPTLEQLYGFYVEERSLQDILDLRRSARF